PPAARLVSLAGGVEDLARAPAGTVQLLGAERAVFRQLRTGSRPPKHGVVFQHPWVHGAPPWQRGAIARAFAAKISLAARADAYTKRTIGPDLLKDLELTIEEIRRRKADKPTRATRDTTPRKRRERKRTRRRGNDFRDRPQRCATPKPWEQAEIRDRKGNREH